LPTVPTLKNLIKDICVKVLSLIQISICQLVYVFICDVTCVIFVLVDNQGFTSFANLSTFIGYQHSNSR